MTIAVNDRLVTHTGNGVTTAFSYDFPILADAQIRVTLEVAGVQTVQTLTTHYTVTISGDGTGTVTFVTAPVSGATIYIEGITAIEQTASYVNADRFPAAAHEGAMDKIVKVLQELNTRIDRAAVAPVGGALDGAAIDAIADDIDKVSGVYTYLTEIVGVFDNAISPVNMISALYDLISPDDKLSALYDIRAEIGNVDGYTSEIADASALLTAFTGLPYDLLYKHNIPEAVPTTPVFEVGPGLWRSLSRELTLTDAIGSPAIQRNENQFHSGLTDEGLLELHGEAWADLVEVVGVDDGNGETVDQIFVWTGEGVRSRVTMMRTAPQNVALEAAPVVGLGAAAPKVYAPGLVAAANKWDGGKLQFSFRRGDLPVANSTPLCVLTLGDSTANGSVNPDNDVALNPAAPSSSVKMAVGGIRPNGHTTTALTTGSAELASFVNAYDDHLDQSGSYYATPGSLSMGFLLAEAAGYRGQRDVFIGHHGRGGSTYANIAKGTTYYNNLIAHVSQAYSLHGVSVPAIVVPLSTNDANASTDAATFKAQLQTLQSDLATDIGAITGDAPICILFQYSRNFAIGSPLVGPAAACFDLGVNDPNFRLACPTYVTDFNSLDVHLTSGGYNHIFAYAGVAVQNYLNGVAQSRTGLWPVSAERVGSEVLVTFNRPVMTLDKLVSDPGHFGVRLASGPVEHVELASGSDAGKLLVELPSSAPAAGSASLQFGVDSGTSSKQGRLVGQRTTLVAIPDEGELQCCPSTGRQLHHYCYLSALTV